MGMLPDRGQEWGVRPSRYLDLPVASAPVEEGRAGSPAPAPSVLGAAGDGLGGRKQRAVDPIGVHRPLRTWPAAGEGHRVYECSSSSFSSWLIIVVSI